MKYWASSYTFGPLLRLAVLIAGKNDIPIEQFDVVQNGDILYLVSNVVLDP